MVVIGIAMKDVSMPISQKAESVSGKTNSIRTLNGIRWFKKN